MVLTLKTRLAASIAIVVLIMGVGSTVVGTRLFGDSLVATTLGDQTVNDCTYVAVVAVIP